MFVRINVALGVPETGASALERRRDETRESQAGPISFLYLAIP